MTNRTMGALTVALALTAARGGAQPQEGFLAVPQMQLTDVTGEVRIETVNQPEAVTGQKLPYIRSGSVIRVLSGSATFESDFHAVIRARKGDAFRFTAAAPEGARPGSVRIAALTEGEAPSLNVKVGGERFRIHKDGVLSVEGSGPGESTVRVEGGTAQNPAVEVSHESALMASPRGMLPNQPIIVGVSPDPEYENTPANIASLAVERKNDTTLALRPLHPDETGRASKEDRFGKAISRWPSTSQMAAELIMNKYGVPDTVTSNALVWHNSGPWQKTVVYRVGSQHGFPRRHEDVIQQTVKRDVPTEKAVELAKMDIGLAVDRAYKELSATSDSEETNFLAVNLANEVINGERSPKEARDFYAKTVKLSAEGKSSLYTQGFVFYNP